MNHFSFYEICVMRGLKLPDKTTLTQKQPCIILYAESIFPMMSGSDDFAHTTTKTRTHTHTHTHTDTEELSQSQACEVESVCSLFCAVPCNVRMAYIIVEFKASSIQFRQ